MNGGMKAARNHAYQQGVKKRRSDAFLSYCCSSPFNVVVLQRPMRLPTHTVEASGAKQGKLDSSFLKVDKTTRAEVDQKLKALDAGFERSRIFWGRFLFTIGRLARAVGANLETIRYYERRGLLPKPLAAGQAIVPFPRKPSAAFFSFDAPAKKV